MAIVLTSEYGRGFDRSALSRMVRFVEVFGDRQIVATLSQKLGCSHFAAQSGGTFLAEEGKNKIPPLIFSEAIKEPAGKNRRSLVMDVVAQPPESDGVNAPTLARIFDDVTNSYKFLFFLALLDNAERNHFDARVPISLNEIVLNILVQAWYPHVYFKISFGKSDRIARLLDKAVPLNLVRQGSIRSWDKRAIRELIACTANSSDLARFVPYRLIRPFFPETRGIKKDHEVNMRVAEMCEEYFPSGRPP